jgi:SAM-dependent methyltransferase
VKIGHIYQYLYQILCGAHPNQNIFHDEWLCLKDIHADLRKTAQLIEGKTLDVGCGNKPYVTWFPNAKTYIGLDIGNNRVANYLVEENQTWAFADSEFDSIVSFQTFEHVKDIELVKTEIRRVLKPGGIFCATIPFIAYEHGAPNDYRRFSREGAKQLFPDFEVIRVVPDGRFGSTTGTLILRWIRISVTQKFRLIWYVALPAWIIFTAFVNVCGWLLDKIDGTGNFYHNVLVLARKVG